jgi:hypothetical protein
MKDSRQKYLDISEAFNNRATEIELFCKQSQRICELLANRLSTKKVKTPVEFENNEYWKDFIMKTAQNNERTIELMNYMRGFLTDILEDSKVLMDGAILRDKLKFQSDSIELIGMKEDEKVKTLYQNKLNEIRSRDTANS